MKFSRPSSNASTKKSTTTKFGKSRTQANVAGYEKRKAQKAKSAPTTTSDLYEHIQEKSRRSKVTLDLDRDEAMEYGVGIDGANEEEREELRARLIGEGMDDEEIASEDDEEIDSDAAFEESDEERFAGFFSSKKSKSAKKQKSKTAVRFAEVDLNEDEDGDLQPNGGDGSDEDEEEEEEGDDDEFIDLLDVLDGKGDIDMGSDDEKASASLKHNAEQAGSELERDDDESDGDDSEVESDEDPAAAEDEEMAFIPSDDDEAPEALVQLQQFVSGLDVTSKKRKAPEDSSAAPNAEARARRRRLTKERTEAGDENEFRAHSSGSKLNLEDLLTPLASQSTNLQSLKKSTKVLAPASSSKTKTLSAPLPQRTQERLDRVAAYEQTKEEVDKWSDTMKRIREAEHLSFPLQAQSSGRTSNLELNAKFKPTTEMESAVDALLKSAKMREEDIHHTEDTMLEMNKLSVEEVAQRRAELRKMRDLIFRAEIKSRRVKKIKSKTYRRIRRKEQERLGEKINEGEDIDDEERKLKQDLDRARERATLRHKHTGKWARQMRGKEGLDEDGRREIEEMLSRGEKLRRRIKGVESGESEGDDEDDSDEDDGLDVEGGIEKIKQGAFEELRRLKSSDGTEEGEKRKGKSVFEMKFMKDAMARQAQAANKEVDDFIKEMGGDVGNSDGSDEEETQEVNASSGVISERIGGRLVFRPGATTVSQSSTRVLAPPPSDTSSVTLKSTDLLSPPPPSPQVKRSPLSGPPSEEPNPWLAHASKSAAKVSKKANEVVVSKDSKAMDKSKNKLKKLALRKGDEQEKAKDDAVVEISVDTTLASSSTTVSSSSKAPPPPPTHRANLANGKGTGKNPTVDEDDSEDSDANLEIEAQEQALGLKGKGKANGIKAFEQRDLVALAFAGDNVVSSFEEAKRREIASDAPREVDTTIPGWGSWGGTGMRKAPTKPHRIKKIAGIDPTTRADYNKHNIIISEKRDKKAGKYLVKDLPYPYTSKAQFERAMDRPLGVEWNTRVGFQRATLPKVVMKPGIIIDPLEKQHS